MQGVWMSAFFYKGKTPCIARYIINFGDAKKIFRKKMIFFQIFALENSSSIF